MGGGVTRNVIFILFGLLCHKIFSDSTCLYMSKSFQMFLELLDMQYSCCVSFLFWHIFYSFMYKIINNISILHVRGSCKWLLKDVMLSSLQAMIYFHFLKYSEKQMDKNCSTFFFLLPIPPSWTFSKL